MTPIEAKQFLADNKVKYVLAQFVDIHGSAKTKSVPVSHFEDIITNGAGFAGFAVWGLGIEPNGPDFMAVGDLDTLSLVPWQPGYARIACDGHVKREPWPLDTRVVLKEQIKRLDARGWTFFTGLEPEFSLLKKDVAGNLIPTDPTDTLPKPCYDYKGLSRNREFLEKLVESLRQVDVDVYQIDHEDANGQFEINYTYADCLTSADHYLLFKMAASEIANDLGMICSFMPKPFANRPGNGMHIHMSIGDSQGNTNLFADKTDRHGLGPVEAGLPVPGRHPRPCPGTGRDLRAHGQLLQTSGGGALADRRHLGTGLHQLRRQQPLVDGARARWPSRAAPARRRLQPLSGHRSSHRRRPRRHRAQP